MLRELGSLVEKKQTIGDQRNQTASTRPQNIYLLLSAGEGLFMSRPPSIRPMNTNESDWPMELNAYSTILNWVRSKYFGATVGSMAV